MEERRGRIRNLVGVRWKRKKTEFWLCDLRKFVAAGFFFFGAKGRKRFSVASINTLDPPMAVLIMKRWEIRWLWLHRLNNYNQSRAANNKLAILLYKVCLCELCLYLISP